MNVSIAIDGAPALTPQRIRGHERLGEASHFDIELRGRIDDPVMPRDVLYAGCMLRFGSQEGSRAVAGVVTRFAVVIGDHTGEVGYRMTMASRFALLELRRLSRTFSNETVPDIIEKVVGAVRLSVRRVLGDDYPPQPYIVQYQETDAAFVRRLCEEYGLTFRFEPTDSGGEELVLEDDSRAAVEGSSLTLVSREGRTGESALAFDARFIAERRPGKVTRRDYDPDHPTVRLEGTASAGATEEQALDYYQAPGRFVDSTAGAQRAAVLLESLRGDARRLELKSHSFALATGDKLTVIEAPSYVGLVRPAGDYTIIGLRTDWHAEVRDTDHVAVDAVPIDVRYRLPHITPRPHIAGVQSATVAGTSGQEIDPDALGRVYLRFHWDIHGEEDPRDNPPFRVMQQQAPGALVVPRVGWEVFVAFEDGDPLRPHVLGRSYNKKQPPPIELPANKTVSCISSDSSPGAPNRTMLQWDDAAGREHMLWNAPYDMTSTIANDRKVHVKKNLNDHVVANLTENVGGLDFNAIKLAWLGGYGTRGLNVGGLQKIAVGGNNVVTVGPERVFVGVLVGEQVGNPVTGAKAWARGAVVAACGVLNPVAGLAAAGAAIGHGIYESYQQGGEAGARRAAWMGGAGFALSFVPGGDAFTAGVLGSSWANAWDHGRPSPGPVIPGGGGAGASGGAGGPAGPGPGYRNTNTDTLHVEVVGGAYGIATPGAISWCTLGPSLVLVRNSHNTKAMQAGIRSLGGMAETFGSLNIDAKGKLGRNVTGPLRSNIPGPVTMNATGEYQLTTKTSAFIKVRGALTCTAGTVTFKVGSSVITASSGGIKIEAGNIKVKKASEQSGSLPHK